MGRSVRPAMLTSRHLNVGRPACVAAARTPSRQELARQAEEMRQCHTGPMWVPPERPGLKK